MDVEVVVGVNGFSAGAHTVNYKGFGRVTPFEAYTITAHLHGTNPEKIVDGSKRT